MFFRWCGPCKILGPRLEKAVAKQKGRVAMAKVDIDDHTDLAIEYGVRPSLSISLWHSCPRVWLISAVLGCRILSSYLYDILLSQSVTSSVLQCVALSALRSLLFPQSSPCGEVTSSITLWGSKMMMSWTHLSAKSLDNEIHLSSPSHTPTIVVLMLFSLILARPASPGLPF